MRNKRDTKNSNGKVEEIVRKEEWRRMRVWVGYGKIRIREQWWTWDEKKKVLRDNKEIIREQRSEKGTAERNGLDERRERRIVLHRNKKEERRRGSEG